jgi:hypothetical protein
MLLLPIDVRDELDDLFARAALRYQASLRAFGETVDRG